MLKFVTQLYPIKIGETEELGDQIHNPDKAKFVVSMRHCYKTIGIFRKKYAALEDFSMDVPEGAIFCLFGVAGVGKTAVISALIGRITVDEGYISVLGYKPGHYKSRSKVGYMPQDDGLAPELTVKEVFIYYGMINGKHKEEIMERYHFFNSYFGLPPGHKLMKQLSGRERKIVSFTAAVIHDPELLILDEPTIEMDLTTKLSVVRYLRKVVRKTNKTIIFATNFIEAAKWATMLGLVGDGYMVDQGPKNDLLAKYNSKTITELHKKVVIELGGVEYQELKAQLESKRLERQKVGRRESMRRESMRHDSDAESKAFVRRRKGHKLRLKLKKWKKLYLNWDDSKCLSCRVFFALVQTGIKRILRNFALLFILVFLPIFQAIIFGFAFTSTPRGSAMTVVNSEIELKGKYYKSCVDKSETCDAAHFSCTLLDNLNKLVHLRITKNKDDALHFVKHSRYLGAIIISEKFSKGLRDKYVKNETESEKADIEIYLDGSDTQIALLIKENMRTYYLETLKFVGKLCSVPHPEHLSSPINYRPPIFGSFTTIFSTYLIMGLQASLVFYFALILSSTLLIHEKNSGIFNRLCSSGISPNQILMVHYIVLYIIMLIQAIILFGLLSFAFGISTGKQVYLMVFLGTLIACSGISCGVAISCLCSNERIAAIVITGSFYPVIMISGILWPAEAVPWWIYIISLFSPLTLPTAALRAIVAKQWGLGYPVVLIGCISLILWILLCYFISLIFIKGNRG